MRSLIAERMTTANREIPHYYLSRDLDVGALGREVDPDRPDAGDPGQGVLDVGDAGGTGHPFDAELERAGLEGGEG